MYLNSSSNFREIGMADSDKPSWKTQERRRQKDIQFLSWVKSASLEELQNKLTSYKKGSWQFVALTRRIEMKENARG